MYINITVTTCLDFFRCHEEFLIQLFVELVEDQTSLCGYQSGVRIGIFFISHIHDGLTLFIYIVHHLNKILLIIAVITVGFGYDRLYILQCTFHNIVHDRDWDLICLQLIHFIHNILADMLLFILCKLCQRTICRLSDCINDLLDIKSFQTAILFDNLYILLRMIKLSIFNLVSALFHYLVCHYKTQPLFKKQAASFGRLST